MCSGVMRSPSRSHSSNEWRWRSLCSRQSRKNTPASRRGFFVSCESKVVSRRERGLLGRQGRPSVARAAWSIELAGKVATTLLARRRPPSEPGEVHRIALPVECPVAQFCGMCRGAGRSYLHNCVPGTSRWAPCLRFSARSRSAMRFRPLPRTLMTRASQQRTPPP